MSDRTREIESRYTTNTDSELPPEQISLVEQRLEEHRRNPSSALTFKQMEARLRSRFPR